jgi:hypothetical protein
MGNLGDILSKKFKSLGIERQVEAVGVVEQSQKEIEKIVPKEDFEVISFNRGVLKIGVDSNSLASELRLKIDRNFQKKHGIKRVIFSSKS